MAEADTPTVGLPESIGRYRIVRLLGEGAMGRVLLAHDPVLDRDVAVKHLRADLSIPDEVRRGLVTRMRHEARAAARVMHPHLVTLHDMGEDERVGLYLVFEYVEGPTLKERAARGALPASEAARVAQELGVALTTAHAAGILHRDIKPENVICSKKGAKIADFGIARIPDSTLTHQGGLMGTPAYSAPETFRTSTFSPESDQFSLAATLYEAVAGKRAFPGDDAVAVAQHILHEPAAPFALEMGLPEAVDGVFARALSRRPRERFASCEAFGRALADALLPAPSAGGSPSAGGGPSAGGVPATGAPAALGSSGITLTADLPHERKGSHVVLGVIAVLVTGALLLRTALNADDASTPVTTASASAAAPPAASSAPRPRATQARPVARPAGSTPTPATTSAGGEPGADPDSDPVSELDGGASTGSDGGATSPAASGTLTSSGAPDPDAGAHPDAGPRSDAGARPDAGSRPDAGP